MWLISLAFIKNPTQDMLSQVKVRHCQYVAHLTAFIKNPTQDMLSQVKVRHCQYAAHLPDFHQEPNTGHALSG